MITSPEYYIWRGFDDGRMDATVTAEGSATYKQFLADAFAGGASNIDEAQWAARKRLWTDAGDVALPVSDLTTDSDKLMQQLTLLILKAGVRDNDYTGLSDTTQKIIRNYPSADTQGLAQALQWGKETYDVLIRGDTITQAEAAIGKLKDSFRAAILQAKDLGLATEELVKQQGIAINKYATDFGQNITDQLLGISDPVALQRLQLERARTDALKEWDYLNEQYLNGTISTLIDRNKINELYDQQLLQVTNQATSQAVADLQDLWKRLTYGDLSSASPAVVLSGAQSTYQDLLARAQAGDSSALAQLSGAASDYVNAQRAYTGNDSRFEALRVSLLSEIAPWVASNGNAAPTVGLSQEADGRITDLMVSNAQLQRQVADLVDALAATNRELSRLRAA